MDAKVKRIEEIDKRIADSAFWEGTEEAQSVLRERTALLGVVDQWQGIKKDLEDGAILLQLAEEEEDEWIDEDYEEGQLSIDVYQTPSTIIVKSTIAGVKPEDIDVSINNDMLTIRGKREHEEKIKEELHQYCSMNE